MKNLRLEPESAGLEPKKLLLLVISTSIVLMVYSYFFPATPKQALVQVPAIEKPISETKNIEEQPLEKDDFLKKTSLSLPNVDKEFFITSKEDKEDRVSYKSLVKSHGGLIRAFSLTDFSKPKELFKENKFDGLIKISSIDNENVFLKSDAPYEIVNEDKTSILFRHITKEGLSIERSYKFLSGGKINEDIEIKNISQKSIKASLQLSLSKAEEKPVSSGWFSQTPSENIVYKNEDFKKIAFKDLIKEKKTINNISYVGFDDQYFLITYIPKEKNDIESVFFDVKEKDSDFAFAKSQIDIRLKPILLLPGEKKELSHKLFLGPKKVDLLASVNPSLEENVEFGWLSVLCRPMLFGLIKINEHVNNFGWAIIIITILIKLLTYPLTKKSFSSQQEMKKIAPKIKELQKKYSHDRTLLGQKQMELYKEHNINPMAGCLPLLIQLPVWFAFYRMLGFSVELYDKPFHLWIHDLTLADPYYILPLAMGGSMLLTQGLMPPQMDQPEMKYVLWGMPILFTFIMLNMPAGLSLYILTNNLLTIAQQLYMKYHHEKIKI